MFAPQGTAPPHPQSIPVPSPGEPPRSTADDNFMGLCRSPETKDSPEPRPFYVMDAELAHEFEIFLEMKLLDERVSNVRRNTVHHHSTDIPTPQRSPTTPPTPSTAVGGAFQGVDRRSDGEFNEKAGFERRTGSAQAPPRAEQHVSAFFGIKHKAHIGESASMQSSYIH